MEVTRHFKTLLLSQLPRNLTLQLQQLEQQQYQQQYLTQEDLSSERNKKYKNFEQKKNNEKNEIFDNSDNNLITFNESLKYSSKFPKICTHISNQLDNISDELILIKSLYITPNTTKLGSKQPQLPELPLYRLRQQEDSANYDINYVNTAINCQNDLNNGSRGHDHHGKQQPHSPMMSQQQQQQQQSNQHSSQQQRSQMTLIGLVHETAKEHLLSSLPLQWSTLIDGFIKDSLAKVTNTLQTMRVTLKEQREILDNIYKISTTKNNEEKKNNYDQEKKKNNNNNEKNNQNMNDKALQHIVTLDRTPINRFLIELKEFHDSNDKKNLKWKKIFQKNNEKDNDGQKNKNFINKNDENYELYLEYQRHCEERRISYWEINNLSYQTLEHKECVILSLEGKVIKVGKILLNLEKERKMRQKEQNLQQTTITTITTNGGLHGEQGSSTTTTRAIGTIAYSIVSGKSKGGEGYSASGNGKRKNRYGSGSRSSRSGRNDDGDDDDDDGDGDDNFDNTTVTELDDIDQGGDNTSNRPMRRNSSTRKNPFAINVDQDIDNNNNNDNFTFDNFHNKENEKKNNREKSPNRDGRGLKHSKIPSRGRMGGRNKHHDGRSSGRGSRYNPDLDGDGGNENNNDDDDDDDDFQTLSNLYGITTSQLTAECNTIQSSLDHIEFELATQVEENLNEITGMINTFQTHIIQQSETIDSIYKDIDIVNHNIDYGNDQLDEALVRGNGWGGAKFYMWLFISCALVLLLFDFILN